MLQMMLVPTVQLKQLPAYPYIVPIFDFVVSSFVFLTFSVQLGWNTTRSS